MSRTDHEKLVLAGDVGGTKTNLGVLGLRENKPEIRVMESYASQAASSLEDLVHRFLDEHPASITSACFGIPGPVIKGLSKTTNLPWVVSEDRIKDHFGLDKVRLVNDLAATANSVPVLQESALSSLNPGKPNLGGTIGLIAPGTGLGTALLVFIDGRAYPLASEGGHVDFAPKNELQIGLLRHLLAEMSHVSAERLGSGPGLFTIYSWLKEYRNYSEPTWLTERMALQDGSKVISEAAIAEKEPLCVEALDLFITILGSTAGNLALTGMTTGGIYLGGGIVPQILDKLQEGLFMKAFTDKGRFRSILNDVPVRVILNDKAAMIGAACCAFDL